MVLLVLNEVYIFTEGQVKAYERIWFFSDEFGSKSFEHFFKAKSTDGYVKNHFDMQGFSNNMFAENPSIIGRMGNLLNNALSKESGKYLPLPKIIVEVPDDDIIRSMKLTEDACNLSKNFGRMVNFVMTEHERAIERSVCVAFQCTFQRHPRPRTYLNDFTGKTSYSLQEGTSASQLDWKEAERLVYKAFNFKFNCQSIGKLLYINSM